jgi:hypothetical protein
MYGAYSRQWEHFGTDDEFDLAPRQYRPVADTSGRYPESERPVVVHHGPIGPESRLESPGAN